MLYDDGMTEPNATVHHASDPTWTGTVDLIDGDMALVKWATGPLADEAKWVGTTSLVEVEQ